MKKKILILVDKFDYHGSYLNGPSRYYSWLVNRIDKTKYTVFLCTLRGKGKSHILFEKENVEVNYFTLAKFNPFSFFYVLRFILKNKIDLLHLSGYGSTTFGLLAAFILRKPTIVHEHFVDPAIGKLHCLLESVLNKFTTKAIAISETAKKFLLEKKGVEPKKVLLVPNGVPLDVFYNVENSTGLKRRELMDISQETVLVGIVAMLEKNKGHHYFIEAASLVWRKYPQTKFLIVGAGELRATLEEQVNLLGMNDHVIFMGQQDNIPEILKMLDIFVLASIRETAPLALLEAMAAGRAIITTDSGGPGEIIKDGVTGIIVPIKNSKKLAEKIGELTNDLRLRTYLASNALSLSKKYDIKATTKAVENLYNDILNQCS